MPQAASVLNREDLVLNMRVCTWSEYAKGSMHLSVDEVQHDSLLKLCLNRIWKTSSNKDLVEA
jgi:hypothetical protein